MDAGLAKILNSTVGTTNMKALDVVLDGVIDDVLTRNRSLVASDEQYYVFPSKLQNWYGDNLAGNTEKTLITFTMPIAGSANLLCGVYPNNAQYNVSLLIYINGVLNKTVTKQYDAAMPTFSEPLVFSKDDTISIRVKHSSSSANRIFAYLKSVNATLIQSAAPTNVTVSV